MKLHSDHGFEVIAHTPNTFQHKRLGFVDAVVMHKQLHPEEI